MFQLRKLHNSLQPISMAALLAFSALSLGASPAAADQIQPLTAEIVIGDVYAELGSVIAVPVTYKGQALTKSLSSSGVASYGIQLNYDPKELSVVSVLPSYGHTDKVICVNAAEGCFQSVIDEAAGTIRAAWVDLSGGSHVLPSQQQLFQIFVRPKGQTGTQALKIADMDNPELFSFTNQDLQPVYAKLTEGKITISSPSDSSAPPAVQPNTENVKIVIDGKEQEQSASQKTTVIENKTVTTISVDNAKVIDQFEKNNQKTLLIPTSSKADVITGELNGKLVKTMENKAAVIQIQTEKANYTLPAAQIKIDQISQQLGKSVSLQDINIKVTISASGADKETQAQQIAMKDNMSLIGSPVDFEVEASYGDKKIEVNQFNHYVDRSISLPEGIDPVKITTGVVLQPDGTFTHVPTKVTKKNNHYYAEINSMTNSTYSVIWNPKSFQDVQGHWSSSTVNNLASRLILSGTSANFFDPDRDVTRAEFTAIILRALGLNKELPGTHSSFTDVSSGDWFAQAVKTAASYKLISGYDDSSFHPADPVTREEAMVILTRASELTSLKGTANSDNALSGFADASLLHSWAREAASQAIQLGLIEGYGGSVYPQENMTRAETAAMVYKLLVNAKLIDGK